MACFDTRHFNKCRPVPSLQCSKDGYMQYDKKFHWYINENEGWQHILQEQTNEIPQMQKMLGTAESDNVLTKEKKKMTELHFEKQLSVQEKEFNQLKEDIIKQQARLCEDCKTDCMEDINAFCTQDILRERIRAIEKSYVELKCNFMAYLSTVL